MKNILMNLNRKFNGAIWFCALACLCAGAASAQTASSNYRTTPRDPFSNPRAARPASAGGARPNATKPKPPAPTVVASPPIQARIDRYKALKLAAMNAQVAAPKPTTALLLSEVEVVGIFRTPRGYAAMVEAKPIRLSYVIYPGEIFYDGQLVAIEENRLVFRRESMYTNGRREVAVETKNLRPANAVADSLTQTRTNAAEPANQPAGQTTNQPVRPTTVVTTTPR